MNDYGVSRFTDDYLMLDLEARASQSHVDTAQLLARIGEVDARRLYRGRGYSSMFVYCVRRLGFSEGAAYKRIQVARAARRFPAILPAVAAGRLHLAGIMVLKPYLTQETAVELISAAEHKTRREIERLVALRFPRPDVPTMIRAIPTRPLEARNDEGRAPEDRAPVLTSDSSATLVEPTSEPAAISCEPRQLSPGTVESPNPPPKVTPLAPERFALQVTISATTHDKLRFLQELLSHQVPSGDVAQAIDRALEIAIGVLEKKKFAATDRPRKAKPTRSRRHIPAHVKRAVRRRDGGQCTYVSDTGHRCEERGRLQFDHVDPVARGGQATVENIRLRCQAHNQYAAECTYGADFMKHKRSSAGEARAEAHPGFR